VDSGIHYLGANRALFHCPQDTRSEFSFLKWLTNPITFDQAGQSKLCCFVGSEPLTTDLAFPAAANSFPLIR
jgi:hypothetical protein